MEHEPAHAYAPAATGVAEPAPLAGALPGYEVGGEIGRGACGIVLAGRHRELGREVAIKRLPRMLGSDPELHARFVSEARLLSSLDHPHIVRIYDFVEFDGVCAFVMQRLNGGTVWDRLQRGSITPRGACAVTVATCSALHYAHGKGVLHRDIKPQNLMFSDEGVLKVTDFGIAKVAGAADLCATQTGHVLGTPAYIAPEQLQGATLGPTVDVYAAGVVLYVLLCGELPFPPAADALTELYQHVHSEPVALLKRNPQAPASLGDVTARALSRDPGERYPSAQDLALAVSRAAAREWGPGWAADSGVVLLGPHSAIEPWPAPPRRVAVFAPADGEPIARRPPIGRRRALEIEPGDALYVTGADESLIARLDNELDARRHESSPSLVRVLCRLAVELHLAGAPVDRCRMLIAEAEAIATALDEPALRMLVLYSELVATWSPDDLTGRLARAGKLAARARQLGDLAMAFRAHRLRLRAALEQGDAAAADEEFVTLDAMAAELGRPWHEWQAKLCWATRALRDGQAAEAHRLMLHALELGQAVEPDLARRCFDDQAGRHRWLVGATRELVPGMRAAAASCPWLPVRRAALAFAFADLRRRTEATAQFELLAEDEFASVPRDANWLLTMVLTSLACARLGDGPRARILHAALAPYHDRFAVAGDCTVTWGSVAAALEELRPAFER